MSGVFNQTYRRAYLCARSGVGPWGADRGKTTVGNRSQQAGTGEHKERRSIDELIYPQSYTLGHHRFSSSTTTTTMHRIVAVLLALAVTNQVCHQLLAIISFFTYIRFMLNCPGFYIHAIAFV